MRFVDPRKLPFVPLKSRGELPHLRKPGGFYFVTFRLADAVVLSDHRTAARAGANGLRDGSADVDPAELLADYEPPLTMGSCALKDARIANAVQGALLFFEGQRYHLLAWCVMPNHVHGILAPSRGHCLSDILHSWKSFTAKQANRLRSRNGPFWERESFDHLIRSPQGVDRFVRYVEDNPVVAGLCADAREWPYSSAGTGFKSSVYSR